MIRAATGSLCTFLTALALVSGSTTPSKIFNVPDDSCTAIAVGISAAAEGEGPMTTHNMDCLDCDFRINKVPAADWPKGSERPLYLIRDEYPQLVTNNRGKTWDISNLEGTAEQLAAWTDANWQNVTGYIPQVDHTYALIEGGYGMMNEFGVAIGESTCQAKFWNAPVNAGGNGIIEVSQMSRIALERTTNARDAIQLMGDLATSLGYYSCTYSGANLDAYLGEGGEALTVIDTKEAWMFHILPDDTGTSAVWVAQRVPDDHVTAVANQFVIRQVDPNNPDFMYSSNLWDVAQRNGFWDPSMGLLDFTPTYSPERAHSLYCTRRVWRVFSIASPSWAATANGSAICYDSWCTQYPFSVKPDNSLTAADVMTILRDHYEGTPFDLTKGLQSGPYGDPNRWDAANSTFNMSEIQVLNGSFERPISMFRTSTSILAQARGNLPLFIGARLFFGQYAPSASVYTPIYVSGEEIPMEFMRGSLSFFDNKVAWWAFSVAANYAGRFYEFAMEPIKALQQSIESQIFADLETLEADALAMYHQDVAKDVSPREHIDKICDRLVSYSKKRAKDTVKAWTDLFPILVTTYHDGYIANGLNATTIDMTKIFYPYWWLQAVGYYNNFEDKVNNFIADPAIIEFDPNASSNGSVRVLFAIVLTSLVSLVIGYSLGQAKARTTPRETNPNIYEVTPVVFGGSSGGYQPVPDAELTTGRTIDL